MTRYNYWDYLYQIPTGIVLRDTLNLSSVTPTAKFPLTMASRLKQKQSDFDLAIKNATTHQTDLNRWRLKDDRGIQTWHYLQSDKEIKEWPITTADKFHMGLDTVRCLPAIILINSNRTTRVYQHSPKRRHPNKPPKMA